MNDSLLQQVRNEAETFGFNSWLFLAQAVSAITIALPILVTIYCLRCHRAHPQLPMWLLLTWLVPVIGPVCTFVALRPRAAS